MKELLLEADRCYLCKNPRCKNHCPISTPIPDVITLFKEEKYMEAGKMLFENNPLTAVCAIVCPHESQCKGNCIRGIKGEPVEFCKMEEFVSNYYLDNVKFEIPKDKKERVAIVGGGPAGITIAFTLALKGYKVTIFDAHEKIGGVLRYGIPEYRLSNSLIDKYEVRLKELGVKIRPNILIGPVVTLDKLFNDGYEAIFIGTGVWNPRTLDIKGETLGHVHYAIDYLKAPHVYDLGRRVCVIGAGDVAMDAARTAKRNGAEEVHIIYRSVPETMTCTKAERDGAVEDGVEFEYLKQPVELTDEGIIYLDTESEIDENGVETLTYLEGTEKLYECDSIIVAVSQSPKNNIVINTKGLETNIRGLLKADESGFTTKEGVFASGDVVLGARTVVEAVAHSKVVAESIENYIRNKNNK
ncbi:MAG: NAD(P)-dependent oxidoreductase [Clostridium sp.]|nr:NAD(P)-dependent oxidoreductase [Clostridium sp.]